MPPGARWSSPGSMGPTGEIMAPMGPLTHDLAVEIFHEQAEGLKAGGADVLWVEDDFSTRGTQGRRRGPARRADMPWCITMSFDTAGRTMMGTTSAEMTRIIGKLAHGPVAYGANCGVGASDLIRTVMGFGAASAPPDRKGQCGHSEVSRRSHPL